MTYEQQLEILSFHDKTLLQFHVISEKQAYLLAQEVLKRRGDEWYRLVKEYKRILSFYQKELKRLEKEKNEKAINEFKQDLRLEMQYFKHQFALFDEAYNETYKVQSIWISLQQKK